MVTYNTISMYLETKESMLEKITAIDLLIDAMVLKMADVVGGTATEISEYSLDDGQMKVRTVYRSLQDVEAGICALEKMKQKWVNKYNGRGFVLRDVRGINR